MALGWQRVTWILVLCACGPSRLEPGTSVSRTQRAIEGGQVDNVDSDVVQLLLEYDNGRTGTCSGTLVGRRTILTAAHCVDPALKGAVTMSVRVHNRVRLALASGAALVDVVEVRRHPDFHFELGSAHDIAVALLAREIRDPPPRPWNAAPIDGLAGEVIRAVGYGTTRANLDDADTRRAVELVFRDITAGRFSLGNGASRGTCDGDSGGPSFHVFPDGVERVVGVHSTITGDACVDGTDTRVDAAADFIRAWFAEREPVALVDAGGDVDAGTDAGVDVDAGTDAGMAVDAAIPVDAATPVDAGDPPDACGDCATVVDAGPTSADAGAKAWWPARCACVVTDRGSVVPMFLVWLLAVHRRRT